MQMFQQQQQQQIQSLNEITSEEKPINSMLMVMFILFLSDIFVGKWLFRTLSIEYTIQNALLRCVYISSTRNMR